LHSIDILSGSQYNDQVFKGLTLSNDSVISSSFHECRFVGNSFVETNFQNCRFIQCEFNGCDLSLAQFTSCVFSGVQFEASRLIGIDWTRADWNTSSLGKPVKFDKCNISHSTFIGLKLDTITIIDCTAHDVDFREADLSRTDFDGTDLTESLFLNTNLSKADFSGARNYAISPETNTLKGAKFSLPEAMSLLFNLDIVLVDDENHERVGG
jgi:uncharacterized protein YjbI with pentapeptide repeats